jgi:NHL repeat
MSARRLTLLAIAALCILGDALGLSNAPAFSFAGHSFKSQITESQIASSPPPAPDSFQPAGLAVDNSLSSLSSGDLYVADGENHVVDKFSSLGVYQSQLTGTPSGPFGELYGVAVDSSGDVYVADRGRDVVDKFSSLGVYQSQLTGTPSGPFGDIQGVAVDSSGDVYVIDADHKVVDKFDSSGAFVPGPGGSSNPFIGGTPSGPMILPVAATVDSAGNIYVTDLRGQVVDKFDSTGAFVPGASGPSSPFLTFSGDPMGVAIDNSSSPSDPGAGDLYVSEATGPSPSFGSPHLVYAFDSSGALLSILSGADTPSKGFSYPFGIAVDSSGRLYVSDRSEHHAVDAFDTVVVPDLSLGQPSNVQQTSATLNGTVNPDGIQVTSCKFEYGTTASYGNVAACAQTPAQIGEGSSPVPVSADIPGLAPDATYYFRLVAGNANGVNPGSGEIPSSDEKAFTTHGPPAVDGESTGIIGKTTATLLAQVNPHGVGTTYHFEYGTTASYGTTVPIPDAGAGSGTEDVSLSAEATGLEAGVIYHFRVVATNSAGLPVDGPDETFRTVPALRIDSVFASEIGTGDATLTAAINPLGTDTTYHFEYGTDTSYGTSVPVPDESVGSGNGDRVVTAHVTGLQAGITYHFRVVAQNSLGSLSSPDAPFETEAGICANAALRTGFSVSLPDCRAYEMVSPPYKADYPVHPESLGVSPDGERAVFTSLGAFSGANSDVFEVAYIGRRDPAHGWVTSPTSPPPVDGRIPALDNDYSPDLTRALTVMVSAELGVTNMTALLSGDLLAPEVSFAQVWPIPDGAATIPDHSITMSATSADLSHAIFTQSVGAHAGLEEVVGIGGPKPLVLPIGGTDASAALSPGAHPIDSDGSLIFFDGSSVRVNDSTTLVLPGEFAGASADGSTVFVTGAGGVLYTVAIDREPGHEAVGAATAVTPGAGASVIRTSDDGSHVYFTSPGVFAGLNAQNRGPEAGASNLYVYDTLTRETKFIAITEVEKDQGEYLAQTTPNGRVLAFTTHSPLTSDDTDTAADVYRYDAQTGALARVSIGEGGADDNGNNSQFDATIAAPLPLYDGNAIAQWRLGTRAISDDGSTIVFSTSEPLSSGAINQGRVDIYAWREGRVSMISTGHSQTSDRSPVVSASGRDIFFVTNQNVLQQDSDGVFDVYDARIGGGIPAPLVPAGGCSGDSCQGPPSVPSLLGDPASATFSGLGNLVPPVAKPKPRCKPAYSRDKRGKCVKRKKKKAKLKKRAKRSGSKRSTGR